MSDTRERAAEILREERAKYRNGLVIKGFIDHPTFSPNDGWAIALRAVERALKEKVGA
jgi:hypothetical protein